MLAIWSSDISKKCFVTGILRKKMVPKGGIEPPWRVTPRDFESRASASSATSALFKVEKDYACCSINMLQI